MYIYDNCSKKLDLRAFNRPRAHLLKNKVYFLENYVKM